ncbi:MAG: hypothetical protein MUE44_33260 [Oscillatoriaceae cyanobacterium Prado104]|jgi:hypothetical protein|nr:hypothetical protein [Oscillatoriaceae cyanobacterium Prado104]
MEPVSNQSQQSSNLAHTPLNSESQVVPSATGQIQQNSNSPEPTSFSLSFLGAQISVGKWAVLGIVVIAIGCTFFLLTKGSEFCFFSVCTMGGTGGSIANDFWGFLGGTATLVILTTVIGVPLVPAFVAAMGIWLLIQISSH